MDGHVVTLRLSWLPVTALRLHPAERGLLQLVPGHDLARQNQHEHHRSLKYPNSLSFFNPFFFYYPSNQLLFFPRNNFPSLFPEYTGNKEIIQIVPNDNFIDACGSTLEVNNTCVLMHTIFKLWPSQSALCCPQRCTLSSLMPSKDLSEGETRNESG